MLSTTTQNQINQEWERKAEVFESSLQWEKKNPVHPSTDIKNDAFRNAFDQIARAVTPFMDLKYFYPSDLLWDAESAARMDIGDNQYIVVRDTGTRLVIPTSKEETMQVHAFSERLMGVFAENPYNRAIIRVERSEYDTFRTSVVHEVKS